MFAIIEGMPYLVHSGIAYPVDIKENGDYVLDAEHAFETDEIGHYMLFEIMAKCHNRCSIPKKNTRKQSKGE